MSEIKDEIFDQNSTLFNVLDENEVTTITSLNKELDALDTRLGELKLQVDGLAIVVNQNQARNEAEFVRINTEIVKFIGVTDELTQQVTTLSEGVANISEHVDDNVERIEKLETEVGEFSFDFESLKGDLNDVKTELNDFEAAYADFKVDVAQELTKLSNRVTICEKGSRYVVPNLEYSVRMIANNNSNAIVTAKARFAETLKYGVPLTSIDDKVYIVVQNDNFYRQGDPVSIANTFKGGCAIDDTFSGTNTDIIIFAD